jgi:hypothetical protein
LSKGHEPDQAVPTDWISLVNERCDLDLAFESLEGWDHFHTDTIRGRIRSLQLRPNDAWRFFRRADERSGAFCHSPLNDLRRFFLKSYRFENAFVEESQAEGGRPGIAEECLSALGKDVPDSEVAVQLRAFSQGVFCLHRGKPEEAKAIFRRLVSQTSSQILDQQVGFYIGLSVAHTALGEDDDAERQIENACLANLAIENTFTRGLNASVLIALFRTARREQEARDWEMFLRHLEIPPKTLELFLERCRRIQERSAGLGRLFLL